MFKTSILALAAVNLALSTLPIAAAPVATREQADRMKAAFEVYLGRPGPTDPERLAITPEGTAYRVDFDMKQILRPLEPFGFSVDPATETLTMTPNDDGTWHVSGRSMPALVMHAKDQVITVGNGTSSYDGIYDPSLRVFTDQTLTEEGATFDQEAPTLSQHRQTGHSVLTQKAAPLDGNRVALDTHYAFSDMAIRMTMRSAPSTDSAEVAPEPPPTQVTSTLASGTGDVHIDRLGVAGLLDLWAFFVAHPSRQAVADAQEELRTLLARGMPFLSGLREAGMVRSLEVQSPTGPIKAASAEASIDIAGLSGAGKVASALKVDGLSLPGGNLPAWSVGLLPTSLDINPTVTGLHVDEGAREAIATFDLKNEGLTPDQQRKVGQLLWPGDGTLTLAPSRIVSPLLDLKLEGEGTIGALPAGHLTVTAAGLDKVIETLQAVADSDPVAGQVLTQVVVAKNLAKPNPDGTLVWQVEASAAGGISVNGTPMK